jgi:hypothetical protein
LDISDVSPATTPSTSTSADAATPIETSKSPETAPSTSIDAAEIASPSPNSTPPPPTLSLADASKALIKAFESPAASSLALAVAFEAVKKAFESSSSPADADATFPSISPIARPTASLASASAAATLSAPLMNQASAVHDDAFSQNDADMTRHVDLFCEEVEAAALEQPNPALPVIIDISGDDGDDDDDDDDDGIPAPQSLPGSSGQGNWLI